MKTFPPEEGDLAVTLFLSGLAVYPLWDALYNQLGILHFLHRESALRAAVFRGAVADFPSGRGRSCTNIVTLRPRMYSVPYAGRAVQTARLPTQIA